MHEGHWSLLRTRRARWYGIAALLVLFVLARFSGDWFETEWLYYRSRYDALDPDNLRAIVIRMSLLLSGLVGSFAFFAVVPRRRRGSPPSAAPPSWCTSSTASSCSARSSPASRAGPRTTGRCP